MCAFMYVCMYTYIASRQVCNALDNLALEHKAQTTILTSDRFKNSGFVYVYVYQLIDSPRLLIFDADMRKTTLWHMRETLLF